MDALITSAFRAIRSLFAPGMFSVFILSIIVTIAALVGFASLVSSLSIWFGLHTQNSGLAALVPIVGVIGAHMLAWFLFPGIMPVIVSFFDNRIADIIEQQDYPTAPAQAPAFWPEMLHDARFSIIVILLNIAVLPLYVFFHVFSPFIFYLLNGYLLGREFFSMAARRHISIPEAEALRKRHAQTVLVAGVALAVAATVPIVNLFAPFWGIAIMVHLYHRLAGTPNSQLLPPG